MRVRLIHARSSRVHIHTHTRSLRLSRQLCDPAVIVQASLDDVAEQDVAQRRQLSVSKLPDTKDFEFRASSRSTRDELVMRMKNIRNMQKSDL